MKSYFLIILFVLVATSQSFGQLAGEKKTSTGKVKFSSINAIGLLSGGNGEALLVQTLLGIAKSRWFAGAGIGLDYYTYRSMPVFIDFRRDILSKNNTPFVYADAGMNVPWATNQQKTATGMSEFSAGYYFDAGIGLKLKAGNNRAFLFSLGYTQKQVKEEVSPFWWGGWMIEPVPNSKEYFDNRFRRLNIKVAVQL